MSRTNMLRQIRAWYTRYKAAGCFPNNTVPQLMRDWYQMSNADMKAMFDFYMYEQPFVKPTLDLKKWNAACDSVVADILKG